MSTSERANVQSVGGWEKRARVQMGKRCLAGERLRHARHVRLLRRETSDHRCATAARPLYQKPVTQRKRVDDDDDVGFLRGGGLCTHALSLDSSRFSPKEDKIEDVKKKKKTKKGDDEWHDAEWQTQRNLLRRPRSSQD